MGALFVCISAITHIIHIVHTYIHMYVQCSVGICVTASKWARGTAECQSIHSRLASRGEQGKQKKKKYKQSCRRIRALSIRASRQYTLSHNSIRSLSRQFAAGCNAGSGVWQRSVDSNAAIGVCLVL